MLYLTDEAICLEILTAIVGAETNTAQKNPLAEYYNSYALGLMMGRFGQPEAGADLDQFINAKLTRDNQGLPVILGLHVQRMINGLAQQGRKITTIGEYVQFLQVMRMSFGGGDGLKKLVPVA